MSFSDELGKWMLENDRGTLSQEMRTLVDEASAKAFEDLSTDRGFLDGFKRFAHELQHTQGKQTGDCLPFRVAL